MMLVLMTVFCRLQAQWGVGVSYYQDVVNFDEDRSLYDATDVFEDWYEFVRLEAFYKFKNGSAITGYTDMDSGWDPINFLIGYQQWFQDLLFVEAVLKKQGFFTERFDGISGEYDQYHNVYQAGLGGGIRKKLSVFELAVNPQYLIGQSEKTVHRDLHLSETNFRALQEDIFSTRDFRSLHLESSLALRVLKFKNSGFFVTYKVVWRRDWFDFANVSRRYEWTWSGVVSEEKYVYAHRFTRLQHHFGLFFRRG